MCIFVSMASLPLFRIRNLWPLLAFGVVALIVWNTNIFFETLKQEERGKVELWIQAQKEFVTSDAPSNLSFEVLQQTGINPMILIDKNQKIVAYKNIDFPEQPNDTAYVYQILKNIRGENEPIAVTYFDSLSPENSVDQRLYYGDSTLLKKLQYYPLALMLIIVLFGAVLYFVFRTNKVSEQNQLWAAMAKETAHQIGTPLSSLLGWIAIWESEHPKLQGVPQMKKDLNRLQTIAERFSKVGSLPKLELKDLGFCVEQTVQYIQERSSPEIDFQLQLPQHMILLPLNEQLFSWTLENLIKNGIDAMKGAGKIRVELIEGPKTVQLLLEDSGNGIAREHQDRVFKPGFSTKQRGWGLGLSLARRIVVDYHKGQIKILKSVVDVGTVFEIVLPKN